MTKEPSKITIGESAGISASFIFEHQISLTSINTRDYLRRYLLSSSMCF
jgi:hypothetical protein